MADKSEPTSPKKSIEVAETPSREMMSFDLLRREVDRLFNLFQHGQWSFPFTRDVFEMEPLWRTGFSWATRPAVDVRDRETLYELTAELPGLSEGDVKLSLSDGVLTIRGEKREDRNEEDRGYYLSERRFGSFQRALRLPEDIDPDKIEAKFKNGVLTVKMPKVPESAAKTKRIEINKE
jgi:HSP20 family protein